GYCWPFKEPQSEALIRLPTHMRPTAITIQHVSQMASLLGTDSSAPRDFTVSVSLCRALGAGTWPRGRAGLDKKCEGETLLATFVYAVQKEPTQTFPLHTTPDIWSNWGEPGYTCIYRVQVHGRIVGTNVI
ncbi:SUN3 protein, partial [Ciccaba nigrolineata]|nr:SUN3 protein [Ciccaba nigrolineata]